MLDALKKDRDTETREGLAEARRERANRANDPPDEPAQPGSASNEVSLVTIRVLIVEPDEADDAGTQQGGYKWANAKRKQLITLEKQTLADIAVAITDRIPDGKHIRAIFGSCEKPPVDGSQPKDIERLCSDDDLTNFLRVVRSVYNPPTLQVVLVREGGPDIQSPPPDDRDYFEHDKFEQEPPHDPVTSDSENELYLIKFGKKKPISWPRTDHGFEHSKAKVRKRIRYLKAQL